MEMTENAKKLTPKKRKAICLLLQGNKISEVADGVGVSESTMFRWLKEEPFQAELRSEELRVLDAVGWQLIAMSKQAVDALEDVLENPSVRGASVKRLTAKDILELLLKWREHLDFDERLTNLEGRVFHGK